jgi:hypothetical protein
LSIEDLAEAVDDLFRVKQSKTKHATLQEMKTKILSDFYLKERIT